MRDTLHINTSDGCVMSHSPILMSVGSEDSDMSVVVWNYGTVASERSDACKVVLLSQSGVISLQ